jgi:hypothetical protein
MVITVTMGRRLDEFENVIGRRAWASAFQPVGRHLLLDQAPFEQTLQGLATTRQRPEIRWRFGCPSSFFISLVSRPKAKSRCFAFLSRNHPS